MSETILDDMPQEDGTAVSQDPVAQAAALLKECFPDVVSDETRDGYSGLVVSADKLVEVATALRDDIGFNYLSSVTGVDQIQDNKMEVVYHTYSIGSGRGRTGAACTGRPRRACCSFPYACLAGRRLSRARGVGFIGHSF